MRCSHIVATGAENASQALSGITGFSVQGDSPAADNLTRKFLLRYYLFSRIIAQYPYFARHIYVYFAISRTNYIHHNYAVRDTL